MNCACPLENFARVLNYRDTIPLVSSITGPIRILIGVVQIVVGTIFTLISLLFCCCGGCFTLKVNLKEIVHGLGNIIRGAIVTVPLLGNLIIYAYDQAVPDDCIGTP